MNARYYDPYLNRFLSADSIIPDPTNPQSYNRYSYVKNNPLKYTDPSGHSACDEAGDCDLGGHVLPSRSQVQLEEWEIRLIILIASFEGGDQNEQHVEYITWIILNRHIATNFYTLPGYSSRTESLLLGDKSQYHVTYGEPQDDGTYDGGIFTWYEENGGYTGAVRANIAYEFYSNALKYASRMNDKHDQTVRNAIEGFNSGVDDPTNGSVYFAHTPESGQGSSTVAWIKAEVQKGEYSRSLSVGSIPGPSADLVYNNLYSPPFGRLSISTTPSPQIDPRLERIR